MKLIYLDNAATTPMDPRVAAGMQNCLTAEGIFGNPSSLHVYGQQSHALVEEARAKVASCIQALPEEIIFTSGATESNNLAIKGYCRMARRRGQHIVTMKTEHKSVLDSCQQLEKEGFTVTYLPPMTNGLLDLNLLKSAIRPDTILVSIMHVNNETGVIQDIEKIAAMTDARGIALHVDAAQSIGKLRLNMQSCSIQMLSLSAHKVYGPKGIGALYLRKKPRVRVEPILHGGGHEQGMRSGTLATHQIVGMGEAFKIAAEQYLADYHHVQSLRNTLLIALQDINSLDPAPDPAIPQTRHPATCSRDPGFALNVDPNLTVPHIINLRFDTILAKILLEKLPTLAASTASACQGSSVDASYVLPAMGLSKEKVERSLRLSLGRFTTSDDVVNVCDLLKGLI